MRRPDMRTGILDFTVAEYVALMKGVSAVSSITTMAYLGKEAKNERESSHQWKQRGKTYSLALGVEVRVLATLCLPVS